MRWLAEGFGARGPVLGVDLSAAFLDVARAAGRSASLSDRLQFIRMDVDHSPLADGLADLVRCAQSLDGLPDPVAAVRGMARVARPV
ncbi:class I SAM-dependent methyltransferase [Paludisphaera mucosa]|uniref:Methyltransferase domain-containing protein n=1 Tax=Paludisphaera mucosa TaxID=3030827 RepID=A0ABT6F5T6_9BACT|nr:methyltransferase domain-containing protein [Paludisphaera mucosa]MDG3002919.1 methyltransferase domain-containing protein [Paludisphaera mucosa]